MVAVCQECRKIIGAEQPYKNIGTIYRICKECENPDIRKAKS